MVGAKNKASVYSPAAQANRAAGDFLRMDAPMTNITINTATGELVDQDLAQHEATIERGLKTFVEVGQALQAIRDGKLYREQYDRFEDYCKERWGWDKRYCNRIISAAEVTTSLGPIGPATESVARPLTKLPADEQADAWEEVVIDAEESGEKITAKKVEQVVAKRVGNGSNIKAHEANRQSSPTANRRTAIELSHDPEAAAKSLVEFFPRDFLVQLVEAINANL
jgi:hypothetical protein